MIFADALLSFATVGLLAGLLALLLRDARTLAVGRMGILLCLTHIAQNIFAAPDPIAPPHGIAVIAAFAAVPAPALLWMFWLMLLDDEQQITAPQLALAGVACLFKLGWALEFAGFALPFHTLRYIGTYAIGAGLMAHVIYRALAGRRDDMIEQRRRSRVVVALVVAGAGGLNLGAELLGMSDNGAMLIRHGLAIMALLAAGWWLVSLDSAFLAPLRQPSHEGASIPAKDRAAYERLMAAMETDKVYLDPELTVSRLAAKIGLPDHQLRSLINQTLGHRNFSSFINGYRLSYAKTLLADPQSARIPILTIAYDSGFQTLSTFNRVFRADRGEAPSDYRRRKLADVVTAETCNLKASSQHAPV